MMAETLILKLSAPRGSEFRPARGIESSRVPASAPSPHGQGRCASRDPSALPRRRVSPYTRLMPAPAPGESEKQALGPESIRAPWRLRYLESLSDADAAPTPGPGDEPACFLGAYWADPGADEANHVIVRTAAGIILLNAYPYASGHLLVALGDARPRLLDYEPAQRARLWKLVELACDLMEGALQPQGVNLGINQGRAAGAGVPGHLHVHLVPRWGGDTNFLTTVGQIRVLPAALDAMAARYREVWRQLGEGGA